MRKYFFAALNGLTILFTAGLLITYLGSIAAHRDQPLPGRAGPPRPATHLGYVTYSQAGEGTERGTVATLARPLSAEGLVESTIAVSRPLFSQPDPPACETDRAHASPNGRFLLLQYNCEARLFARLLQLADQTADPPVLPGGYFLDWSPDGRYLLFGDTDNDRVMLVEANTLVQTPLDLPSGTYGASFMPDGRRITYVAGAGLGLGSELGRLNLADGSRARQQTFPDQVVAFPRWSPDGAQLVYILMPDSNIPFTVGELWLAHAATGEPLRMLAEADAGHGYPPAWSPDGRTVAYVHRQNPGSTPANHVHHALRSNIYQVETATGQATPLTHFQESLVYDAAWSPDGRQLAFTADDAVWVLEPGQEPVQVSRPGIARHPVWLVGDSQE